MKKWEIGDEISNRLVVHDAFSGGMGIVYIVYDRELTDIYAVKTFRDDVFALDSSIRTQFEKEAQIWVNLDNHRNVTKAHFLQRIENRPYLFLEYVNGGDLSSWIGSPRLIGNLTQVVNFAIQICDGMVHAVSKGIVAHRDIKPKNCLISLDNVVKVTDFGLAKVFSPSNLHGSDYIQSLKMGDNHTLTMGFTQTGMVVGTPAYMSPELFDDAKHIDIKSDVYSFGVMLYEMVSGILPFNGNTIAELEAQHKTEPPPTLPSSIHPKLNGLISQCMAKDPSSRPAEFSSIRDSLISLHKLIADGETIYNYQVVDLDAFELSNKGISLSELGYYTDAIQCFDDAIKIDPQAPQVWTNKGVTLKLMGRTDEAFTCFERSIEIDPGFAGAYISKGNMLRDLFRHQEALDCFDQALNIDNTNDEVLCGKGEILSDLGQIERAMICFDDALKYNPNNCHALCNKGLALSSLKRFNEAIHSCEQAIALDATDDKIWYNYAVVLRDFGAFERALECYRRSIAINPNHSDAWWGIGIILNKMNRLEEEDQCYDKALSINSNNDSVWLNKAICNMMLGRFDVGIMCCDKVLAIRQNDHGPYMIKGGCLAQLGNHRNALKCFQEALKLGYQPAQKGINTCLEALGQ